MKEHKEIFIQSASLLKDYKKIPQMDLVKGYDEDEDLRDSYYSAIVLRYWPIVDKMTYKDKGIYDYSEAFTWLIDGLMYMFKHRPWDNPNNSLYQDPKALERSINTFMKCARANWFQASNRFKRKVNHGTLSLEGLTEEYRDAYTPDHLIVMPDKEFEYSGLVIQSIENNKYLLALIIDIIINDLDVQKCTSYDMTMNQIRRAIKSLPREYYLIFSEIYDLDINLVEKFFNMVYNMSDTKLKQSIEAYSYQIMSIMRRNN